MHTGSRRSVLRQFGAAAVVLSGLGAGTARAGHDPEEPRIEFHRQTRRLDADTPSVLVARADLPRGGFVMVHDKPASGGHHANVSSVDDVSGTSGGDHSGGDGGGGEGGEGKGHSGCEHGIYGITEYLAPGHYGGVTVPLERVPTPGTYELVAMLHEDDGNEEFDGCGTDGHYSTDGSHVHAVADVRFISPTDRSR
jgi:hypothetical protein